MKALKLLLRFFIPKDGLVILALVGFIVTSYLGFWQLSRAAEKKHIQFAAISALNRPAIRWDLNRKNPSQFQNIHLRGRYLPVKVFLDNQYYQHAYGYDVLTPFLVTNNRVILIDRGWMKGNPDRKILPAIDIPLEATEIAGQVYYPSKKSLVLGSVMEKRGPDLVLLERLDTEIMTKLLHKSVYPFIIRLNKMQKHGFSRNWSVISMPPARHYAYAFQWFVMAFCLLFFVGFRQVKR